MQPSLFEEDVPGQAKRLAPVLRSLADRGLHFGTSSWKYEGWLGSVYNPDRYLTRGRVSKKKFEAECLREYAETFDTVGGDFSFYQFPKPDFWSKLFEPLPERFTFGLKVPEEVTVLRWPGHGRYGARAGTGNDHFLDAKLFEDAFLRPLEPYKHHVAAFILEFGTFARSEFLEVGEFLPRLERFLDSLPGGWRYSVEIRNEDFLSPKYFAALARRNVAHVFNAWTRMPTLGEQVAMGDSFTADFTITRALLRRGRGYENAVKLFEPYKGVQEPDEPTRLALKEIAIRTEQQKKKAYAYVNNRLEGNAPGTIEAVADGL